MKTVQAAAEELCETHEYAAVRSAAYDCILNKLHPLYVQAGEESMAKAAANISTDHNDNNNQGPKDIVASFDGSWQRRGYASLNGIVSCIERTNDKIVDVEVKTKKCNSCHYDDWKKTHVCNVNHEGSAAAMETSVTLTIYNRSIEKRNLRYTTYLGDDDSKSHPNIVEADPYKDTILLKEGECIGHVQKRVGSNLRRIRKESPKG
eukprot:TCONS_00072582-protein